MQAVQSEHTQCEGRNSGRQQQLAAAEQAEATTDEGRMDALRSSFGEVAGEAACWLSAV